MGSTRLELPQVTVKAALQAQQPGQSVGLRKISTVQADASEAGRGLDCMRASSGEPLPGNAVNDGGSSPGCGTASAAKIDAAACRRSDSTASGALLGDDLHHALPLLQLRQIIPRTPSQGAQGSSKTLTMCCLCCGPRYQLGGHLLRKGRSPHLGL